MVKQKKLSLSKASGKHFTIKAKPIPVTLERKLAQASSDANIKISRNNQVYASSNSHASYYATK